MEENLLMTYALLSHLKETRKSDTGGLIELFVPIVKKGIAEYAKEKNSSEIMGKSIIEIQTKIKSYFGIEIPPHILGIIFNQIEKETDDKKLFQYFSTDGSFIIKAYIFSDLDGDIQSELSNIEFLKKDFSEYCAFYKEEHNFQELESFVLSMNIDLFSDKDSNVFNTNYLIPKYVKERLDNERIFKILSDLYLGSIISSYLKFQINTPVTKTELLIDTNFFISLIDLNTEEAYNTCNQLFELCKTMGFQFKILYSTIEQIKVLLNSRIGNFSNKDIGIVKSADVFGACIRRKLSKTELERIKDHIETTAKNKGIETIHEQQIRELIKEAKASSHYKILLEKRNNNAASALNDTVAYLYIQGNRKRVINEFSDVNCWFLHNSFSPDYEVNLGYKIHERNMISANELLTLLWLSNPNQSSIDSSILVKGGLSSYIAKYRSVKIPSETTIRLIKEKADDALKNGKIEQKDIYKITMRMAEGHLTNGEAENLVQLPDEEFISVVSSYSKEEIDLKKEFGEQNVKLDEQNELIKQLLKDNADFKNQIVEDKYKIAINERDKKVGKELITRFKTESSKMNKTTIIYIFFVMIILTFWFIDFQFSNLMSHAISTIISLVLLLITSIIPTFINGNSVGKCLKFTFSKKNRDFYLEELRKKIENEIEIPNHDDFFKGISNT